MGIIERVAEWNRRETYPDPLNMTDREILDWIEDMRPRIQWEPGNSHKHPGVKLFCPYINPVFGKTLEEAVCLAAAQWKEFNS